MKRSALILGRVGRVGRVWRVGLLVAMLVVVVGSGRTFAHHSFTAAYESGKRVEIEGVVKEFVWRNPHSFVRIEVMKDGKPEIWNLEWGSSTQLSAAKYPVTRTTLKFGDRIIAAGEPGRDPEAHRIRIFSIKRPVDGWEWQGVVE
jgi:uncharacterized protein DUF6152